MTDLTESFPWLADVQRSVDDRLSRDTDSPCAIHVCLGRHCQRKGGRHLVTAFERAVEDQCLGACPVVKVGCRDRCDDAPSVDVFPGPARYNRIGPHDADRIVSRLAGNDPGVPDPATPDARPPWERDRTLSRREQRHAARRRDWTGS